MDHCSQNSGSVSLETSQCGPCPGPHLRPVLSSVPSPRPAVLPFPVPSAPAEPRLACGWSREPAPQALVGWGGVGDQLSLHQHHGDDATSIMSFPQDQMCPGSQRVSLQATKHTHSAFGAARLAGAQLCSLSLVSSESSAPSSKSSSPSSQELTV